LKTRQEYGTNPIELLVLSACQTASGDNRATLGLAGVAVRSGARSTLATLWSVNDESTAQFMETFYQKLTQPNVSRAEALRLAQIEMIKSGNRRPFLWAPFILVGNWF
jgi:CHAT domain-containing protein